MESGVFRLHFYFFDCVFETGFPPSRADLKSLSCRGWPWTYNLPASTSRVLRFQARATTPCFLSFLTRLYRRAHRMTPEVTRRCHSLDPLLVAVELGSLPPLLPSAGTDNGRSSQASLFTWVLGSGQSSNAHSEHQLSISPASFITPNEQCVIVLALLISFINLINLESI